MKRAIAVIFERDNHYDDAQKFSDGFINNIQKSLVKHSKDVEIIELKDKLKQWLESDKKRLLNIILAGLKDRFLESDSLYQNLSLTERSDIQMLQAYQGYFDNGRFISPEAAEIPDKARVIVMLLGEEIIPPIKTRAQEQLNAVKTFISDASGNDELSAEDYAELGSGRYRFNMSGRVIDL